MERNESIRAKSEEQEENQDFAGAERDVLPPDAPRLFCILGDLENSPDRYERAWTVSKGRYSRAQRSLGWYHVRKKNYSAAAEAYAKSLEVNRLNSATWFALGCVQLELEQFQGAVESFTRTVQLEADDAEAWSNLAAALLRLPGGEAEAEAEKTENEEEATSHPKASEPIDNGESINPAEIPPSEKPGRARNANELRHDALHALRRAATLKHSSPRIWDNYLTVAASIPPPQTPWNEAILAQKRLIEIRGKDIGEKAVDEKIMSVLVKYVTTEFEYPREAESKSEFASAPEFPKQEDDGTAMPIPTQRTEGQPGESVSQSPATAAERNPASPFTRGSTPALLISLLDAHITPLITTSAPLWHLVSSLNLWRHRPLAALEALERAWRCVTAVPGVYERPDGWTEVVAETLRLVRDGYQALGPREREREKGANKEEEVVVGVEAGDGDGGGGVLVARDWRFKARSALRAVMGRGRGVWEDSEEWEMLGKLGEGLRS